MPSQNYLHIVQLKSVFKRPCHHLSTKSSSKFQLQSFNPEDLCLCQSNPKPHRLVPSSATVIACAEKGVHQSQMMGAETALVLNKLHQLRSTIRNHEHVMIHVEL